VPLVVQARRFFCDTPSFPRRIFVEPFSAVLAPFARQTERLRQIFLELAHARNAEMAARLAPPPRRPSLARLVPQPTRSWPERAREALEGLLQAHSRLAQGDHLKARFQALLARRDRGAFDQWLDEAEVSDVPSFQAVAQGFRHDIEAITAAFTSPWSPGQCEGQICRVKLLKRQGYGRAKLDLLCQRILHRIPAAGRPSLPPRIGLQQAIA
jgi:transposase